ncbi:sh3 domain-containing protein [Stemphylium lycopersici]|uniref:Sh3 domain-containing protein n=1 Tax=Stemphylium lycopersici TaxID=183478 RepID=A0A364N1F2_STELY|nr:sh3 domain-containing protein [Stemphylium lycopersici]RAR00908.1 sh3 domain-containing protein [Stemphylium lycopersici]RAR08964.1 sh3 domain-containing protein [Stemphylium lycopersici]
MADSFRNAMINRSLGDIKNNLQFLVESNVITTAQQDAISAQLPVSAENSSRALPAVPSSQLAAMNIHSEPTPPPEKKNTNIGYYSDAPVNAPPPAYPSVPATPAGPPVLCHASAMYQYNAQDAGDLALQPNDKVAVTEYMNNEWWKGRNERTGMEGIFPASYVRKEEKSVMPAYTPGPPAPSNYGNMPLDVASGAQAPATPAEPSKAEQQGKKFGKKLGNAAIFGAGASIGGKIVNGIF